MAGSTDAGMGVGRRFSVGRVNTDGIVDICVSTASSGSPSSWDSDLQAGPRSADGDGREQR